MAFRDATAGLRFAFDWMDAERVSAPELAATWASLRIDVGDTVITRIFDERSRTIRDMVFVPLYPLAEWLVTNWWFLLYEFENPAKENDPAFFRRHSLASSREGYGYPNLQIISSGRLVRLVWTASDHTWFRHTSLEQGWTWIDRDSFHESCANLIESVLARLHAFDIRDTLLEKEWSAIQQADNEESEFCKTAAGLGWDPYAIDDDALASILTLGQTLDGVALEEAAAAIPLDNLSASVTALHSVLDYARQNILSLKSLTPLLYSSLDRQVLFETRLSPHDRSTNNTWLRPFERRDPWYEGYALARNLREILKLGRRPLPTLFVIASVLGESPEQVKKVTRPKNFGFGLLLEGMVTRDDNSNFAFAFSATREESKRFLFCRALADVLTTPETSSVLTKARSWRQQRGRAFAAEFLAPSSAIRERVSSHVILEEDIDRLAKEFGVSSFVIAHQIDNHSIAPIWSEAKKWR